MRDCERCGGEASWTKDTVQLAGQVSATLCNPCLREYNDVFFESEEYAESLLIAAQQAHYESLAQAQAPVSQTAWDDHFQWQGRSQKAFAAMSTRFLATTSSRGQVMQPYQMRVLEEKAELDVRLEGLRAFLAEDTPDAVDATERKRMSEQARIMADYSAILKSRIAAFRP